MIILISLAETASLSFVFQRMLHMLFWMTRTTYEAHTSRPTAIPVPQNALSNVLTCYKERYTAASAGLHPDSYHHKCQWIGLRLVCVLLGLGVACPWQLSDSEIPVWRPSSFADYHHSPVYIVTAVPPRLPRFLCSTANETLPHAVQA